MEELQKIRTFNNCTHRWILLWKTLKPKEGGTIHSFTRNLLFSSPKGSSVCLFTNSSYFQKSNTILIKDQTPQPHTKKPKTIKQTKTKTPCQKLFRQEAIFQKFSTSLDFCRENSLPFLPCYLRLNMAAVLPLPQEFDGNRFLGLVPYPCCLRISLPRYLSLSGVKLASLLNNQCSATFRSHSDL